MTGTLLAAALILADPGPGGDADATAATVKSLVQQAASQYDQRQFEDALQTLQRAYGLSPRPSILYNIAQAQRQRGDCNAALVAYEAYVAQADAADPKRAQALSRLAEMRACMERDKASGAAQATGPPPPATAPVPPSPAPPATAPPLSVSVAPTGLTPPSARRRPPRWAGWTLVAAGAVLEVGAAALEWKASSIQADLDHGTHSGSEIDRLETTGSRDERWAIWSAIAGGVLAGSGATLLVIGRASGPEASRVALVSWVGAF